MESPAQPAAPARVTAIVVSYDGATILPRCLAALAALDGVQSVLVVDNASVDGSAQLAATFPKTTVLPLRRNYGFGKANNRALARLLADPPEFILLLNQDAWLDRACLDTLVRVARANPDCAIVSPLHFLGDERTLDPQFARNLTCPELLADLLAGHGMKPLYRVEFVNAAVWLLRGDQLGRLGGFDPLFPHYGEDNEYCDRVRAHGLHVAVAPAARAVHARIRTGGLRRGSLARYVHQRASRHRANAIGALRAQKGLFVVRLLRGLVYYAENLETALHEHRFTHVEAVVRSFVEVTGLLPFIWYHRRRVRHAYPHFLSAHRPRPA